MPEDDFRPTPPDRDRVAARALVLAAVSCRAFIEKDARKQAAEDLRQNVVRWLFRVRVAEELEQAESSLLSTPVGKLDDKAIMNATWQSEGMVVLAWALGLAALPPVQRECDAIEVADALGFLEDRDKTVARSSRLRNPVEIEFWADTYLTLHWRLRQFHYKPARIDFVNYVSSCAWGPLRLDHLEILNGDLAIDGEAIEKLEQSVFRRTLSITQERHQAFNWLLGLEPIYSQVTTDT